MLSITSCSRGSYSFWPKACGPDLKLERLISISLLSFLNLIFSNWAFSSPRDIALLAAGNIVKGYIVILLLAVLRAVASCTTKATPGYTLTVLCCIAVLVALKALSNIAAAVK